MHHWALGKVKEVLKGKLNKENLETKIRELKGSKKAEAEGVYLQEKYFFFFRKCQETILYFN